VDSNHLLVGMHLGRANPRRPAFLAQESFTGDSQIARPLRVAPDRHDVAVIADSDGTSKRRHHPNGAPAAHLQERVASHERHQPHGQMICAGDRTD